MTLSGPQRDRWKTIETFELDLNHQVRQKQVIEIGLRGILNVFSMKRLHSLLKGKLDFSKLL